MAKIFGISRHRLTTDGQGVTTLVAFSGCPLRCDYCINHICHSTEKGKEYTPQSLYDEVKIDDLYFRATNGGITFGGGEPALQSVFIEQFRQICGSDWRIVLETSLNVDHEHVIRLIPIVDDYIIDIKDMNDDIYYAYTHKHNNLVISNLLYLIKKGLKDKITIRIPLIKGYNNKNDIARSKRKLEKMGLTKFDLFEYDVNHAKQKNKIDYEIGEAIPPYKFEDL